MRLFWSVVLTGGLLLVGVDVYESQTDTASGDVEMSPVAVRTTAAECRPPPPPPPR